MASFPRELRLGELRSSAFLFGPRMTGKTTLLIALCKTTSGQNYFDLLHPETELRLRESPHHFWEQVRSLPPGTLVIVDEIQKIPTLLNYVQMGIDRRQQRFLLSGSSARKLKRGSANLLGGRAIHFKLHPLTVHELGEVFEIRSALRFGTLPKIAGLVAERAEAEARRLLQSYVTTYIKEEIQAEALTRNVGAFQRFLSVAAQSHGQVIAFANISRECSVPMSTVKEYYQIVEDTLLGEFLWPYDRSERKKARPKFYFFDCGVIRALQQRLTDPPTAVETGILFETFLFRELTRIRDYGEKEHEICVWRRGPHEIDFLIASGKGPFLAIECKSGRTDLDHGTIHAFRQEFPKVPLWVASLTDDRPRQKDAGVTIYPWAAVVQQYRAMP